MMIPSNIHHLLRLSSFFLLGTSAWILVNGILYAEIPIIVAALDYDYTVVSTITLCVTLSNIAPLLWSAIADVRGKAETQVGIGIVLALGLATTSSLSLTDAALQKTSLVAVSVCVGIVGTMSPVLLFPHASSSIDQITAMASGTAIANLFAAVLAIIQLTGNEEGRFSIQVYFGILTAVFGLAIVGFIGTLRFQKNTLGEDKVVGTNKLGDAFHDEDDQDGEEHQPPAKKLFWSPFFTTTMEHFHVNAAQFVLNALTFFLVPGVVPFSIQHFPGSNSILHYLTVSQILAQTFGILLSGKWQYSKVWIQILAVVVVWIPTVVLSILNDEVFHETQVNAVLPITLIVILNFLYGYSTTNFFHLVTSKSADAPQSARVLGAWNQLGAMSGSLVGYFLVHNKVIQ
jgi:hypothetical protein